MKVNYVAYQGDVEIAKVDGLPAVKTTVPRINGKAVLAEGESTGHSHAILEPDVEMYQGEDGNLYVHVPTAATVVHEEHGPIGLDKGDYRVTIQREYHPAEIRRVRD